MRLGRNTLPMDIVIALMIFTANIILTIVIVFSLNWSGSLLGNVNLPQAYISSIRNNASHIELNIRLNNLRLINVSSVIIGYRNKTFSPALSILKDNKIIVAVPCDVLYEIYMRGVKTLRMRLNISVSADNFLGYIITNEIPIVLALSNVKPLVNLSILNNSLLLSVVNKLCKQLPVKIEVTLFNKSMGLPQFINKSSFTLMVGRGINNILLLRLKENIVYLVKVEYVELGKVVTIYKRFELSTNDET